MEQPGVAASVLDSTLTAMMTGTDEQKKSKLYVSAFRVSRYSLRQTAISTNTQSTRMAGACACGLALSAVASAAASASETTSAATCALGQGKRGAWAAPLLVAGSGDCVRQKGAMQATISK